MKNLRMLAAALFLAAAALVPSAAEDFDWSQCWCTYGGGIEKGDWLITVDAGLDDYLFKGSDYWAVPYAEVAVAAAVPVWKLPFTFGGYVGMNAYGWKGAGEDWARLILRFGGEALYHVCLPPEGLDVYSGFKAGVRLAMGHDGGFDVFDWQYILGANWFFTRNFGVNLELGAPVWAKAGVTFRL